VQDGIALERRGVPAAVVCTEPFARLGRASAEVAGLPDNPFALVRHPVAPLDTQELRVRAEEALSQVLALLTATPSTHRKRDSG
jgi:hypothetical protein